MEIVEICSDVRLEPGRGICLPRFIDLLFARLVHKAERNFPIFQERKAVADRVVDGSRSLAAAKNEQRVGRLMRFFRNGFELRPDRISRDDRATAKERLSS